ncbi:MAG: elongation factor P [Elusimicrobia bacterium]|nr:elongation factor P [Candidatus Obscuribacterium magneticum]
MIETSDFKNGTVFEWDDKIFQVVWFQHHKPGKGGAMLRVKLKNMRTGDIIERTFKSGEKFREVQLSRRKKQYLYTDGEKLHFVDMETYEDLEINKVQLGGSEKYLAENMEVEALYLDKEFLNIQLPASVVLNVARTVPGVKGDSVSNMMKPATLETGLDVQVPLFVSEGESVKVDTRTGEYVERVQS